MIEICVFMILFPPYPPATMTYGNYCNGRRVAAILVADVVVYLVVACARELNGGSM